MRQYNVPAEAQWFNRENAQFYDKLGTEGLKARAVKCGLTECPDLRVLIRFLESHRKLPSQSHILEIGAGYGRVAKEWLRVKPVSQLSLVEFSSSSARHLRERFRLDGRVSILEGNLLELELPRGFHLALWMWAGSLDFSAGEKAIAFQRILRCLRPGGVLAVEVPRTVGPEVKRDKQGNMVLDVEGSVWRGHVLVSAQLNALAVSSGFQLTGELNYETATGLQRTIHLYEKAGHES